jgi:hypothetical protein
MGFGLFYSYSEYENKTLKGKYGGFNPFAKGNEYIFQPGWENDFSDMNAYNKFAYSLIEFGEFRNAYGHPSAFITPGLPLVLALIYFVFGYGFIPVLIFNALCITFAYYFLFLISNYLFNRETGYLLLIFSLLNLKVALLNASVWTEPLFILLLSAMLFIVVKIIFLNEKKFYLFAILGFLTGYNILVRPIVIPLVLFILVLFIFYRTGLKNYSIYILLVLVIPSIWIYRNYVIFDRILLSSASEVNNIYTDYEKYRNISIFNTYSNDIALRRNFDELKPLIDKAIEISPDGDFEKCGDLFVNDFKSWVEKNKLFYIKICIWRFKALLLPYTADMSKRNIILSTIIWFFTFFPVLVGIFLNYKNKYYLILFIVGILLLIIPSLSVVDKYLRYQVPTHIIFTLLSSYTVISVLNYYKKINRKPR